MLYFVVFLEANVAVICRFLWGFYGPTNVFFVATFVKISSGVNFINGFAPLHPTFVPCAQLLRSFLLEQMLGAGRERSAQGAKQFMKSTPGSGWDLQIFYTSVVDESGSFK